MSNMVENNQDNKEQVLIISITGNKKQAKDFLVSKIAKMFVKNGAAQVSSIDLKPFNIQYRDGEEVGRVYAKDAKNALKIHAELVGCSINHLLAYELHFYTQEDASRAQARRERKEDIISIG